MKTILVPCDFSAPAREAFKLALDIAASAKGEVIVLYAVYIPVMYDPTFAGGTPMAYDPALLGHIEEDAKKAFTRLLNEFNVNETKVSLDISYSDVFFAVKQTIKNRKADLVVMGTTGASGFKEIFIGSNTEKIVRHSPVPVIAVRTAPNIESIKKILLPTTLTLDQTEFINKVKELQAFFNASLEILLINTPVHFRRDAEAKEAFEEFVKHYKLTDYKFHFRNYRDEEEGIIDFARSENIGLIAMATHARKGLSHLFAGSITEDVVNHGQSAIWTCHINHYENDSDEQYNKQSLAFETHYA